MANQLGPITNGWQILPTPGVGQPTSRRRASRALRVCSARRQPWPEKETGHGRASGCFAFCWPEQPVLPQARAGRREVWRAGPSTAGLGRGRAPQPRAPCSSQAGPLSGQAPGSQRDARSAVRLGRHHNGLLMSRPGPTSQWPPDVAAYLTARCPPPYKKAALPLATTRRAARACSASSGAGQEPRSVRQRPAASGCCVPTPKESSK